MANRVSLIPRAIVALVLMSLAAPTATTRAADVSRLFTASEFPRLAVAGEEIPNDGRYTVKVWAPKTQQWSSKVDGQTVTLSVRVQKSDDTAPRWQTIGEVALKGGEAVKIKVAEMEQPGEPKGKSKNDDKADAKQEAKAEAKKGEKANQAPAKPAPFPALLALSTNPNYDAAPALEVIRGALSRFDRANG